jgi:cyanate permease
VDRDRGRGCAWAAFIAVVLVGAAFIPTWGFSLLLWPIPAALSVVAWFRSRRDGLFWIGVALNGFLLLGFATKLTELDY